MKVIVPCSVSWRTAILLLLHLFKKKKFEKMNHDVPLKMEYRMLSNAKVLFLSTHIILITFSPDNSIPLVEQQCLFILEKENIFMEHTCAIKIL